MGTPSASAEKVSGTKIAEQKLVSASEKRSVEQKLRNKNCSTKIGGDSWPLGDGDPKCHVEQKGQRNKNCGTKIGGDSWPLGDGDPKCKCKKVSGTKIAEQKLWNKNWWVTFGQKVSRTKMADPKLQVQKGQWNKKLRNKNCGTKIAEQKLQNKKW